MLSLPVHYPRALTTKHCIHIEHIHAIILCYEAQSKKGEIRYTVCTQVDLGQRFPLLLNFCIRHQIFSALPSSFAENQKILHSISGAHFETRYFRFDS